MSANDIEKLMEQGAKSALFSWSQSNEGADDLVNELWVWYLESPATQKKLQESDRNLARKLVYKAGLQILAKKALGDDEFYGRTLYTTENVKDALADLSTNRYLKAILPTAMEDLEKQNPTYAGYVKDRYEYGVVPPRGPQQYGLSRAIKSLTEHVNVLAITADMKGPGSKRDMQQKRSFSPNDEHPDLIRAKGEHSDPTANIAIMLVEHPELRDEYLHEEPITEFTK